MKQAETQHESSPVGASDNSPAIHRRVRIDDEDARPVGAPEILKYENAINPLTMNTPPKNGEGTTSVVPPHA
jgi:hypothetical protein